jgi:hypothetical protein
MEIPSKTLPQSSGLDTLVPIRKVKGLVRGVVAFEEKKVFVLVLTRRREIGFKVAIFGKARENESFDPSFFTNPTALGKSSFEFHACV